MFGRLNYIWVFAGLLINMVAIDSCRPKEQEDVAPVDSTAVSSCILLSERINNVLSRTYEYDSTRQLTRMLEYSATATFNRVVKRYTFEYNDQQILTRLRETNLLTRDKSYIYDLDYFSDGMLKTIRPYRVFNSGPRAEDTLTVVYGARERIMELRSQKGLNSRWEYDTEGNVKKWLIYGNTMQSDSLLAEYGNFDDKVNIYAFSQGMQLINLLAGRAPGLGNPLVYTADRHSVEAVYQYNNKRVPTQAVLKFKAADNTLRETVYTYELSCR